MGQYFIIRNQILTAPVFIFYGICRKAVECRNIIYHVICSGYDGLIAKRFIRYPDRKRKRSYAINTV